MIILITGSNGFLGRHFVETFYKNNYKVIGCDIDHTPHPDLYNLKDNNDRFCYHQCDITDEEQVKTLFKNLELKSILPVHLINNAAVNPVVTNKGLSNSSRLESFVPEQFLFEASVSLIGSILCSKYMYLYAKNHGIKCNIVNISSDLGLIAPNQNLYRQPNLNEDQQSVKPVSYSVIKHAVHGLTKYLATYSPSFIRANSLFPGGVFNEQSQDFLDKLLPLIPMSRMANPSDLDGALLFLCSDQSRYMTGSSIVVDGGRSIW